MKTTSTLVLFWQDADIYSNFHPAPFTVDGRNFHCSEQYFMHCKATHFADFDTAVAILAAEEPLRCKELGRSVRNFDSAAWDQVRERYMFEACHHKFRQNPRLKTQLLATHPRLLVEASPFDRIWGIGLDEEHPDALDPLRWPGQNLLGQVLMAVRAELLEQK